jgi:adenosine 3'-phospho 5'-phosphosulfate transporter B3
MLIGVLLLGKRFSSAQAAAAVMLCFGLIGFTLADKDQTESFSPLPADSASASASASSSSAASATTGVVMLTVSVLLDATIPNFYERLFTPTAGTFGTQRAPATDFVMMWVNAVALITLAPALVLTGQLADALAYFAQPANWHLAVVLLVFALLSYAGISCMLLLTSEAGGIFSTALATARKAVTIALSFVLFPGKRFTPLVACAGALVLGGIALGATASKHGGGAHSSAPASSSDAGHATAAEKSPLTGVASQ